MHRTSASQPQPTGPSLDLPPMGEVERRLGLLPEDRRALPGLVQLNTVDIPLARAAGFTVGLAVGWIHNHFVLGGAYQGRLLAWGVLSLIYCVASWLILRHWFPRMDRIHLGDVFVVLDVPFMVALVAATGGAASLLWPVLYVRVADQVWIGQRRALYFAIGIVGLLAMLFLAQDLWGSTPVQWGREGVKLLVLAGSSFALARVAAGPWDVKRRALASRDLIQRLEEQSVELDRERRRAEAASLAKSEFLARMSHELRTPLNSVVGFTNVLTRTAGLEGRSAEYLQRVRQNAVHLLALINDILDLSRIQEGQLTVQMSPVDLRDLVTETVAQMEGRTVGQGVALGVSVPSGLRPIWADEDRLRQVLINLVGNALKFTEKGRVDVSVMPDAEGRPRILRVRDTGVGIAPERMESIFQPFEQGEGGTDRRFPGTGLGLAVSRSLCDLMDLTLEVESQVGVGSTFSIVFPVESDA